MAFSKRQLLLFGILPLVSVFLAGFVALNKLDWFAYLYVTPTFPPPSWERNYQAPYVFTKEELAASFNGKNGRPSYLVVLGEVYDVTGSEHYKEGNGYSVFVGRDASTAFVTGVFDGSAPDDVSILSVSQMKGIEDWVKFYRYVVRSSTAQVNLTKHPTSKHETYKFKGVVQGKYYNKEGRRTSQWQRAKEKMDEAATEAVQKELEMKATPSCNSRWAQGEGTTIWCENSMVKDVPLTSSLVPRKLSHSDGTARCVCVELNKAQTESTKYEPYPNCGGDGQTCRLPG